MMLGVVLPLFQVGSAAVGIGIAEAAVQATIGHVTHARFEESNSSLADLPTLRAQIARMRIETDRARAHLGAVLDSLESPGPATQLMVLEAKASATEAAVGGHRTGDADVRRRGVRRRARHRAPVPRRAGADRDGADERRRLRVHRPRPVRPGGVLMAAPAEGRGGDVRPQGLGDLGNHPRLLRRAGRADRRRVLLAPTRLRTTALLVRRDRHRLELAARVARRAAAIRQRLPRHRHARHRSRSRLVRRGAAQRSGADARGPAGPHDRHRRDRLAAGDAHPARPPAPRGAQPRSGRHGPAVRRPRRQARRSRRRRARRARPASRRARPRRARCST